MKKTNKELVDANVNLQGKIEDITKILGPIVGWIGDHKNIIGLPTPPTEAGDYLLHVIVDAAGAVEYKWDTKGGVTPPDEEPDYTEFVPPLTIVDIDGNVIDVVAVDDETNEIISTITYTYDDDDLPSGVFPISNLSNSILYNDDGTEAGEIDLSTLVAIDENG